MMLVDDYCNVNDDNGNEDNVKDETYWGKGNEGEKMNTLRQPRKIYVRQTTENGANRFARTRNRPEVRARIVAGFLVLPSHQLGLRRAEKDEAGSPVAALRMSATNNWGMDGRKSSKISFEVAKRGNKRTTVSCGLEPEIYDSPFMALKLR
eukprot:GHVT01004480.1.p1 GENE.GHVT01004480.1~~GHVT01004480.1.p1  ORF type:complete len:151 (-),score=10.82 GHVT01004480.1:225-677(-)